MAKFEGKVKGRLKQEGEELRLLNRVVRRTADGYEWEADQRHAELIITGMGLLPESKPLCPRDASSRPRKGKKMMRRSWLPTRPANTEHLQLEPTSWQEIGPTLPSL